MVSFKKQQIVLIVFTLCIPRITPRYTHNN